MRIKQNRTWMAGMIFFLAACSRGMQATPTPTLRPNLATPHVYTTSLPQSSLTAQAYLEAWKAGDTEKMYAMLATKSQASLTKEQFIHYYQEIATQTVLSGLDIQVLGDQTNSPDAQVRFRENLHTIAGEVMRENQMSLSLENGQWRVNWEDGLGLPELKGGNFLRMDWAEDTRTRAKILDRDGNPLASQAEVTTIGITPDELDLEKLDHLLPLLARVTGLRADTIQALIEQTPPGEALFVPLAEVPKKSADPYADALASYSGVYQYGYTSRYYDDDGSAPHAVGYVSVVMKEEADEYLHKGYVASDLIGRIGLESWGETTLAGVGGGVLNVINPQGQTVGQLAQIQPQPAQDIYSTLQRDFQEGVQASLSGFPGASVVLERDTGRVLAMASSPAFDPNAFIPANANGNALLRTLMANPDKPLLNRASSGLYPLGSVFKIVTMAAALESGKYTRDTTYDCGYDFTELPGVTLHDWTWEFNQTLGTDYNPSGMLNLVGGLTRSCDPFFWHLGVGLFQQGLPAAVTDMARGFGLGQLTGIQEVEEQAGNIPDPPGQLDQAVTNIAIGQGDIQVTPLQVADFIAAVGNGGTLYRPQLVEKIAPPNGAPTFTFTPQIRGKLPVKPENLAAIQEGMVNVISGRSPRGTALEVFSGMDIPLAGKSGTAQTSQQDPHAWFAAYTMANQADKPDIAIAVMVENRGEGTDIAAPIVRRIIELYFSGKPRKLFPWEKTYYVTRTPTPEPGGTPTP